MTLRADKQEALDQWEAALADGTLDFGRWVTDITKLGAYGWRLKTRLGTLDYWPTTGTYVYNYDVPWPPYREGDVVRGTAIDQDDLKRTIMGLP